MAAGWGAAGWGKGGRGAKGGAGSSGKQQRAWRSWGGHVPWVTGSALQGWWFPSQKVGRRWKTDTKPKKSGLFGRIMMKKLESVTRGKFSKSRNGNQLVRRGSAEADSGVQKMNSGSITWERKDVAVAGLHAVSAPLRSVAQRGSIQVGNHSFKVSATGKALERVRPVPAAAASGGAKGAPAAASTAKADQPKVPSRMLIGGRTFVSQGGGEVLVRDKNEAKKMVANRSSKRSLTYIRKKQKKSKQPCMFYCKFGKCSKQAEGTCPYIHDKAKIHVCRKFLKGECFDEECLLSHTVAPDKMPVGLAVRCLLPELTSCRC